VGQLRALVEEASRGEAQPSEALEFPAWNRSLAARVVRRISLPAIILPLTRLFAWIYVEGRTHLAGLEGPVIFASNRQSYMDTPVVMAALPPRWRYRLAPAMAKEFFKAHFFPKEHGRVLRVATSAAYYLAALVFNAFPLPQREAGAADAALHGRAARGRLLHPDFSGGTPYGHGRDRSVSRRHRHDRLAA
jgi:hypothetical protein